MSFDWKQQYPKLSQHHEDVISELNNLWIRTARLDKLISKVLLESGEVELLQREIEFHMVKEQHLLDLLYAERKS